MFRSAIRSFSSQNHRIVNGRVIGLIVAGSTLLYASSALTAGAPIYCDSPAARPPLTKTFDINKLEKPALDLAETVDTGTSVSPFPKTVAQNGATYDLIGLGTRKVTFLNIKVYVVGIYVARDDLEYIRQSVRLARLQTPAAENITSRLLDPIEGHAFFSELVGSQNVSFLVRIVPTRNTDFAHLRDGFLRGIIARTEADPKALESFKEFFPKRSFPKDNVLHLTLSKQGGMGMDYNGEHLGQYGGAATKPIIEACLLNYLAGKKNLGD